MILITGGTGGLGSELVERFLGRGDSVRVLSRKPKPAGATTDWARSDMETGEGLAEAVN